MVNSLQTTITFPFIFQVTKAIKTNLLFSKQQKQLKQIIEQFM